MSAKELNNSTFDSTIAEGVTLVDFWAPWCMPCKAMLPILENVAKLTADLGNVTIAKVNVDEFPALANRFSVSSIPTLLLFRNGALVERKVGMQSAQSLVTAINTCRAS